MSSVHTYDHPATDSDTIIIPDFLLIPVIETAYDVISKLDSSEIPTNVSRLSSFDKKSLKDKATRAQIISSIKTNNAFKTRVEDEFFNRIEANVAFSQWNPTQASELVADAASRNDLALLASVLWLKQPEQYQFGLGLIVATSSVSIIENEQREFDRADETRFNHLSSQLESEKSRADLLKTDVDRLETELRQERSQKRIGDQRNEAHIASLKKKVESVDEVVQQHEQSKARVQERLEREASRAKELEARLKMIHDENRVKSQKISSLQDQLAAALSSDVELNYDDLQNLLAAQKDAQNIAELIMSIMNKTRSIISKTPVTQSSGTIEPTPITPDPVQTPNSDSTSSPSATGTSLSKEQKLNINDIQSLDAIKSEQEEAISEPKTSQTTSVRTNQISKSLQSVLTAQSVLIVDGSRVAKELYPSVVPEEQRNKIIEDIAMIEAKYSCSSVVVFDGEAPTARGRVQSKVHFVYAPATSNVSAVILERIKITPKEKRFVLVSSDPQLILQVPGDRCDIVKPQEIFDKHN